VSSEYSQPADHRPRGVSYGGEPDYRSGQTEYAQPVNGRSSVSNDRQNGFGEGGHPPPSTQPATPQEENYRDTAVLYLQLDSLANYVDTLTEDSLHRYTEQLHQVVFAAAGFYAGDLHVARQFGLAIYFCGTNKAGSAAFRAASCAWLIQSVSRELEKQMSLSLGISMAVAESELGLGDGSDIYPGLYMQHTIDELQLVCAAKPPHILLSPKVCEDVDVASRLQHRPTEVHDYAMLEAFSGNFHDLLERQLRLVLKRLNDPGRRLQGTL